MQVLHRVLNMHSQRFPWILNKLAVLNMLGLRIWLDYEYARFTQGAECA